ncbi:MAG: MFS transporter [Candidatus Binataceae bacterium]
MVTQGVNVGWLGPFLAEISASMRVPIDRGGLVVSAVAAGYFAALIAGGEIAHRRSAQQMLRGAMVLVSAGLCGVALAPRLGVMLVAAAVAGLGQGAIDIAANAIVADLNRERLGAALNYLHVMFGIGALLGPVIAGFALRSHVRYEIAFGGGAAVTAMVAMMLWRAPAVDTRAAPDEAEGALAMLAHPTIWVIAAVLLLYVGAETGVGAWLFSYLRARTTVSAAVASWAVSLYWSGLVAGRMAGGALAHRSAPKAMSVLAALLSAVAIAGLVAGPSAPVFAAAMIFLIGVGYGPVFPNMIAIGAAAFPAEVGRMTSVVAAGGAIGAILVPWMMGYALAVRGARTSMQLALGITALMIACLCAVRSVRAPREDR